VTDVVLTEPAAEQRPGAPSRPARHGSLAGAVRTIPYAVIGGYLLVALLGGLFVDYDPLTTTVTDRLLPPGSTRGNGTTAWLGTDAVGRDVLAQVVLGARTSVTIAVFTVLVSGVLGVTLGLLAGYLGGWVDTSVARTIDILVAFPGILLAIVVAGLFHRGYLTVIIALAVAGWIGFARVVRGVAMSLRERDWVDAARVMAVSRVGILTRHVLPFVVGPVVAMATLEFALVVLAEAGLSFLGIGLPPTAVSWGQTVASGKDYLEIAWWISAFPGLALAVLVISVGLVGDQLTARYGGRRRYR
jgi:peptide/nickel transport system permease protein